MAVWSALYALLALSVVFGLVTTSAELRHETDTAIRDTRSLGVISEFELTVLHYQRISNRYLLTEDPALRATLDELSNELERLSAEALRYAAEDERELLDQAFARLTGYLDRRRRVARERLPYVAAVRSVEPVFRDTLEAFESLRARNEAKVELAHRRAGESNRLANVVGASAGALLLLGFAGAVFGIRRIVLAPLADLQRAVIRFRGGDTAARARAAGGSETIELARAFNDMADELKRQREAQLAFLASVAHDLRTPLGALMLALHALDEGPKDARERRRKLIERQVQRLTRMVGDLLDATRIEAGELDLEPIAFDLRQAVGHVVELLSATAPDHPIVVRVPETPVVVHADPLRLEQVIANLTSNAIKFSPRGGAIEIDLTAEPTEAVLAVRDHGIGIRREDLDSLFAPFRRIRPDIAPGAGLGLSVVHRIVAAHDGRVEVESEPGAGSLFRVRLARLRAGDDAGMARGIHAP